MSRLQNDITLDQIDSWFTIGKKVGDVQTVQRSRRRRAHHGQPNVVEERNVGFIPPYKRNENGQQNYAEQYQEEENEFLKGNIPASQPLSELDALSHDFSRLSQLEIDSTAAGSVARPEELIPENAMDVYNNYAFPETYENSMPIVKFRDQIVSTIESNQVTVIQGSTGSGKTTQVPQYILSHYAHRKQYCNIIVTQPRRIAAQSIARRVCSERNWELGTICGYQVGLDKTASEDTRLIYVTTGTLLRKLINAKDMTQYTHVILDEVHERDQETDFALLVVRKFLRTNSRHVKVVLMSATLQSDLFAEYFALPVLNHLEPAPVLTVEGKMFKVSEYYADQITSLGALPILDPNAPCIPVESQDLAVRLIQEFDNLEAKEQGLLIWSGCETTIGLRTQSGFAPGRGSVLIFLPGYNEIVSLEKMLDQIAGKHKLTCIPLHSSISQDEQFRVFEPVKPNHRKVILSTNIAESSITVTDVKYVIDFCLTKQLVCDPETNYTSLILEWASKSNCVQRKGRAGRVSNGRVYRLVSKFFYDTFLEEHGIPEMQRCPLEKLVLEVKLLDLGEPKAILALALSPPRLDDIEKTILFLMEVGALAQFTRKPYNRHDGDLTFVGRVLAKLPVDIRIGKLLVLGHVFGVLEECLIIGAALSLKTIFSKPYRSQLTAYKTKLAWADGSFSDCLAVLTAYKTWTKMKNQQNFRRSGKPEAHWGSSNNLQIRRLKEVVELSKELEDRLKQHNILRPTHIPHFKKKSSDAEERLFLKLVFCGAFYPNYFVQGKTDEKDALKTLSGKDPLRTVMIKGFPQNHGSLYKAEVEKLFKCCDSEPRAHFEETRGFVEFCSSQPDSLGKVHQGVYFAVKMRALRMPLEIQLLSTAEAHRRIQKIQEDSHEKAVAVGRLRTNRLTLMSSGDEEKMKAKHSNQVPFPDVMMTIIKIYVTEVVECGHFWVQHIVERNQADREEVHETLNSYLVNNQQAITCRVTPGMLVAAPYKDVTVEYFRARVQKIHFQGRETEAQVFFVDYGNTDIIPLYMLRQLPQHIAEKPFQALECQLAGIRPSVIKCPDGKWSPEANKRFKEDTLGKTLFAQIYSIVDGVMRVNLLEPTPEGPWRDYKDFLHKARYADRVEESIMSRQHHEARAMEAKCRTTAEVCEASSEKFDFLQLHMDSGDASQSSEKGRRVRLTGPTNPFEMDFYSLTNVGRMRQARIDPDSVNSVVIDDSPQDAHGKMMVAASVGLNATGSSMICRDTTILPRIPGLAALVSLVFAPVAEIRANREKTCYTGALCGLGYDPNSGGPALPDHDMEITFDTKITMKDLYKINGVRMAINIAIGSEDTVASWGPDAVYRIQESARKKLLLLIERRRKPIEPQEYRRPYCWNQVAPEDVLQHELHDTSGDCPMLLRLHFGVALAIDEDDDDDDDY